MTTTHITGALFIVVPLLGFFLYAWFVKIEDEDKREKLRFISTLWLMITSIITGIALLSV